GSTMKGGFSRASLCITHQTGTSEDDDDDDQPIGIRIRIKTLQRKTPQCGMVEGKIITSMLSHSTNQPTETVAPEPKTPSTELVEFPGVEGYSSEFFDRQASCHLISVGSGVRNDLGKYRKRRLPIET
ncbi:hypothetical protein HN873_070530, partial [Arachis hypogaea]